MTQPALLCWGRMEAAIRAWPVYLASTSVFFVSLLEVERRFPGRDLAVVPAQGVSGEVSASAGRQTCPMNPLGARGAAPSAAEFSAHRALIHKAEQHSQEALLGCVVQMKHSEVCLDQRTIRRQFSLFQRPYLEQKQVLFLHVTPPAWTGPLLALPGAHVLSSGCGGSEDPAEILQHPCSTVGLKLWALLMQSPSALPGLMLCLGVSFVAELI